MIKSVAAYPALETLKKGIGGRTDGLERVKPKHQPRIRRPPTTNTYLPRNGAIAHSKILCNLQKSNPCGLVLPFRCGLPHGDFTNLRLVVPETTKLLV